MVITLSFTNFSVKPCQEEKTAFCLFYEGRCEELHDLLQKEFHVKPIVTPYKSPWCNGHCERMHLSLKKEVLSRIPINSVSMVNQLCSEYKNYYNNHRPHQGIDGNTPVQKMKLKLEKTPKLSSIKIKREVSGLISRFYVEAA